MTKASASPREGLGQLLVKLLYEFRQNMLVVITERGYSDLRPAHGPLVGNLSSRGIRLTDLAARTYIGLAAASELVTELEQLGYVERRPDPSDRRAKLIVPTEKGKRMLRAARRRVEEVENQWAQLVGADRFEEACQVLHDLLESVRTAQTRPHRAAG